MQKHTSLFTLVCSLFVLNYTIAQTTINYQASTADFANPERGFYRYSATHSDNYSLLSNNFLTNIQQAHTPPGNATYSIYSTLVFRYFLLEDFTNSTISQSYLNNMQTDFDRARAAGVKIIPRFAYTDQSSSNGCSASICPPYGDAPKNWVLTHISQLTPILEANKDVIACVQMGFIGIWGENYYTDYFGDASQGPDFKLLDNHWQDRIDVLNALLAAVPNERMVQVRYPQKKQRAIYGINASTGSSALTLAEAYSGSYKARLGFHNDCLLASADDFGTYTNYGNSSSPSSSDTSQLKPYMRADSKFVVVGGETCNDGYSPQNDCASSNASAYGDTELAQMHYSYLNAQYNNEVNNDWQSGGCMDDIKKRLGYRFELQQASFSNSAQDNQVIDININLKNQGYAAPYNARGIEIILRNSLNGDVWTATLNDDPRLWFAGNNTHTIQHQLCIPASMPAATYELLLNLPDPMPSLHDRAAYAIRLANLLPNNADVWEASTGYNQLGHTILIDNSSNNAACNGEITFEPAAGALAADLLSFTAERIQKDVLLAWITTNEEHHAGFNLERSTNGKDFSTIHWQTALGGVDITQQYTFVDTQVNAPIVYYRLAQKDMDGSIEYSKTISINAQHNASDAFSQSLRIYPNPLDGDLLNIDWDERLAPLVRLSLVDVFGQTLLTATDNTKTLDLSHLAQGSYFLIVQTKDKQVVRKVLK